MTWVIKLNDMDFSSDDFLIEDLAEIEKVTGTPWSVSNPMREIKVARAFLAAAMVRSGKTNAEVETALNLLTLKRLKKAFTFEKDEEDDEVAEEEGAVPLDLTTPDSSSGEPPTTTGRRVRSVASA